MATHGHFICFLPFDLNFPTLGHLVCEKSLKPWYWGALLIPNCSQSYLCAINTYGFSWWIRKFVKRDPSCYKFNVDLSIFLVEFFKIHRIRLANHHHGTNHQLRENVFGYFFMFASKNHKSASNWAMKKHLGCSGYIGDEILVSCVGIILIVRVNRG